jgi:hypothetical protein
MNKLKMKEKIIEEVTKRKDKSKMDQVPRVYIEFVWILKTDRDLDIEGTNQSLKI